MPLRYSYPLRWPPHYTRAQRWEKSINQTFKMGMSLQEALTFLNEEVDALKPQNATLYTDYENLGNPRLMRSSGYETGVALSIKIDGMAYDFACDRWVQLEQNIYALHLALRSLRNLPQWGVGTLAQAFGGFGLVQNHIPPSTSYDTINNGSAEPTSIAASPILEEWRLTLGLGPTATLDDAQAVYRRRAKSLASDEEALMKLNLAMDAANKALR